MSTLLLVGTAKGLFILQGNSGKWSIDGPHFPGLAVYSAFFDRRKGRNVMWAGPASWHFGAELCKSVDMGKTWDQPEKRRIKMPAATKTSLENIWQIAPGANDDTIYVGTAPGGLFESHDQGETWKLNSGLWKHKHRKVWAPGFGGLCLHTIVTDKKDPNNLKIAVSSAGVYQSADGGEPGKQRMKASRRTSFPTNIPNSASVCIRSHGIPKNVKRSFCRITTAFI